MASCLTTPIDVAFKSDFVVNKIPISFNFVRLIASSKEYKIAYWNILELGIYCENRLSSM